MDQIVTLIQRIKALISLALINAAHELNSVKLYQK